MTVQLDPVQMRKLSLQGSEGTEVVTEEDTAMEDSEVDTVAVDMTDLPEVDSAVVVVMVATEADTAEVTEVTEDTGVDMEVAATAVAEEDTAEDVAADSEETEMAVTMVEAVGDTAAVDTKVETDTSGRAVWTLPYNMV